MYNDYVTQIHYIQVNYAFMYNITMIITIIMKSIIEQCRLTAIVLTAFVIDLPGHFPSIVNRTNSVHAYASITTPWTSYIRRCVLHRHNETRYGNIGVSAMGISIIGYYVAVLYIVERRQVRVPLIRTIMKFYIANGDALLRLHIPEETAMAFGSRVSFYHPPWRFRLAARRIVHTLEIHDV